ncbi:unnamed protein product [Protopolystoma xenopodis]|uniref:Secreted protein n=1 Tax=Protopolystoma xenopodis TaxID=117903 RepID=A0A448WRE5_9PLAT|nr:unnamed protein product [Protopolystoma xenopodis]
MIWRACFLKAVYAAFSRSCTCSVVDSSLKLDVSIAQSHLLDWNHFVHTSSGLPPSATDMHRGQVSAIRSDILSTSFCKCECLSPSSSNIRFCLDHADGLRDRLAEVTSA